MLMRALRQMDRTVVRPHLAGALLLMPAMHSLELYRREFNEYSIKFKYPIAAVVTRNDMAMRLYSIANIPNNTQPYGLQGGFTAIIAPLFTLAAAVLTVPSYVFEQLRLFTHPVSHISNTLASLPFIGRPIGSVGELICPNLEWGEHGGFLSLGSLREPVGRKIALFPYEIGATNPYCVREPDIPVLDCTDQLDRTNYLGLSSLGGYRMNSFWGQLAGMLDLQGAHSDICNDTVHGLVRKMIESGRIELNSP
jgi:hypothetical protein